MNKTYRPIRDNPLGQPKSSGSKLKKALGRWLRCDGGAELVEWIVLVALLAVGIGSAVVTLRGAIQTGINAIATNAAKPCGSGGGAGNGTGGGGGGARCGK